MPQGPPFQLLCGPGLRTPSPSPWGPGPPTTQPRWQFPRIHMVMKASIFSQTHTGPSDPPGPPAQWPPAPRPATCWTFPGKGGKGWRRRAPSSQPPAPFAPCSWSETRGGRPGQLPPPLSSLPPQLPHLQSGGDGTWVVVWLEGFHGGRSQKAWTMTAESQIDDDVSGVTASLSGCIPATNFPSGTARICRGRH